MGKKTKNTIPTDTFYNLSALARATQVYLYNKDIKVNIHTHKFYIRYRLNILLLCLY